MTKFLIEILRTPSAAEFLGLAPSTLEKYRINGGGPVFIRLGVRAVGYRVQDLRDWLHSRRVSSTSEARERDDE